MFERNSARRCQSLSPLRSNSDAQGTRGSVQEPRSSVYLQKRYRNLQLNWRRPMFCGSIARGPRWLFESSNALTSIFERYPAQINAERSGSPLTILSQIPYRISPENVSFVVMSNAHWLFHLTASTQLCKAVKFVHNQDPPL